MNKFEVNRRYLVLDTTVYFPYNEDVLEIVVKEIVPSKKYMKVEYVLSGNVHWELVSKFNIVEKLKTLPKTKSTLKTRGRSSNI